MEKLNQQPESSSDQNESIESEVTTHISNNLALVNERIRSCSTVSDTHIHVNPNTGEFLSIGDGIIPENSYSVDIKVGDKVPEISDVFFWIEPKPSRDAIIVVRETIKQWNESLKRN